MSEEHLSALLAKLKHDSDLRDKMKRAEDLESLLAIAKESGFSITPDDLVKAQLGFSFVAELTDAELETVAGGQSTEGTNCADQSLETANGEGAGRNTSGCCCPGY